MLAVYLCAKIIIIDDRLFNKGAYSLIMNEGYRSFVGNIEAFIRKYYVNQLIRGLIYSIFLLSLLFLLINGLEYLAYLKTTVRLILFYGYIAFFCFIFWRFITIPVYKLIGFRKSMTYEQAAAIIGTHFPEVSDKLLNTLQLHALGQTKQFAGSELLKASIEKKIKAFKPISFKSAIDLKKNLKFLRIGLIPVLLLMGLLWLFPSFIREPSGRLVRYNESFSRPAPFEFVIVNTKLSALQQDDYQLIVRVIGESLPAGVSILTDEFSYPMTRLAPNEFQYDFKHLQHDIEFKLAGGGVTSKGYRLIVWPKPSLSAYTASIDFPAYTRKPSETIRDIARFAVPQGSRIAWSFYAVNADSMLVGEGETEKLLVVSNGLAIEKMDIMQTRDFSVSPWNKYVKTSQAMDFQVEAISDEYPQIQANIAAEERGGRDRFFSGMIQDDYGFTQLTFNYQIENAALSEASDVFVVPIVIDRNIIQQTFFYFFSVDSVNAQSGDRISYYFEVWDNDGVQGAKSRKSGVFTYEVLSQAAMDSITKQKEVEREKSVQDLLKDSKAVKEEIDAFLKKMTQKAELDWNDKNQLKAIIEKQQQIQDNLNQLREKNEQLEQMGRENQAADKRILEKQDQLNKLFDEVMNDEIRALMDQLQKMLDDVNKDQLREMMKDIKMNNESMERMLDRNLALLKKLQVEKDMSELTDALDKMATDLENQAEAAAENKLPVEEQQPKLEMTATEFQEFRKALDSVKSRNEQLDRPFSLGETTAQEDQISKELQDAAKSLEKNATKKSNEQKKNAAGNMKKLSLDLKAMMEQSGEKRKAEDAHTLRIILENVLRASLSQEDIMNRLSVIRRDDPAYSTLIRSQSQLRESFVIIQDSLIALGKRQAEIESFVFNEIDQINLRINNALEGMKERRSSNVAAEQQYSMMSLNNLGLMLAEALKKMQESMGMPNPMQGEGNSKEGENGSEGLESLKEMQDALGKQLKEGLEKMQGQGEQGGSSQMSEELARMAAQQEALRNEMQSMMEQFKKEGLNGDGLRDLAEEMEKIEEALVNKQLNRELVKRNEDLVSRLLKAENAERERELQEKRESSRPKDVRLSNPEGDFEYKTLLKRQQDAIKLAPLVATPYYRKRINAYLLRTNEVKQEYESR